MQLNKRTIFGNLYSILILYLKSVSNFIKYLKKKKNAYIIQGVKQKKFTYFRKEYELERN